MTNANCADCGNETNSQALDLCQRCEDRVQTVCSEPSENRVRGTVHTMSDETYSAVQKLCAFAEELSVGLGMREHMPASASLLSILVQNVYDREYDERERTRRTYRDGRGDA